MLFYSVMTLALGQEVQLSIDSNQIIVGVKPLFFFLPITVLSLCCSVFQDDPILDRLK